MKSLLCAICLLAALSAVSAQTTKTHCDRVNDSVDCTTTDSASQEKSDKEFADAVVGNPIMALRVKRGIKKYCKQHPGEPFHWTMPDGTVVRRGVCPKAGATL